MSTNITIPADQIEKLRQASINWKSNTDFPLVSAEDVQNQAVMLILEGTIKPDGNARLSILAAAEYLTGSGMPSRASHRENAAFRRTANVTVVNSPALINGVTCHNTDIEQFEREDLFSILDPLTRQIVRLHVFEDASFWEIATRLKQTYSTVYRMYTEGIALLRAECE